MDNQIMSQRLDLMLLCLMLRFTPFKFYSGPFSCPSPRVKFGSCFDLESAAKWFFKISIDFEQITLRNNRIKTAILLNSTSTTSPLSDCLVTASKSTRRVWKFLDYSCCNPLGERRWAGRPRSLFRKRISSVCHMTLRSEHTCTLLSHECFFEFVFRFVRQGWQMRANLSALSFAWCSVNSLPKPLKCFVRLLENIL
jgi:hypothetical protein